MKYLPIGLAVVIMIAAGALQGKWSERWGTFPELQIFSEQLDKIPLQIGEWKGADQEKSDERTLKIAGAEGELVRTYRNAHNEEVRISIICARLQDIFYHTPDRCYPAAGFEMQGEPHAEVIDCPGDVSAEFFTTSFLKSEATGTHTERGFWSWSGDGQWVAPKNPKLKFAGQQHALYKLYVFASEPSGKKKTTDRDFARDFIRAFIPALEKSLRPAMVESGRLKPAAQEATPVEPAEAKESG
jgi:EpsI family protein